MKNVNIMGHAKFWLSLSAVIVGAAIVVSIVTMAQHKLNLGIDFTGGSLMEVSLTGGSVESIKETLLGAGYETTVQASQGNDYFVRLAPISEAEHQRILEALKAKYADTTESQFTAVGPTIGQELGRASIYAIVLILALIGLYIAWAFRKVSFPVASWKYALVTMATAFHDVIIPFGVFAILGRVLGYQIDTAFVAALLTILGYSINDTIVVLDRTRENLVRHRHDDKGFAGIVNQSVMETLARSVNTTLAVLLPLLAIFFLGGETTRPFVLALIIGILSGAYSSIFVASPLLVMLEKWGKK